MSIKSISFVETTRDTQQPKNKKGDLSKPKTEALVDAIPTEVLAPYTAILAVIVANTEGNEWEIGRWIMYGIAAVIVPIAVFFMWRRDKSATATRRSPVAGMVAATAAFGAWGLVMPGAPLTYSIHDASSLTIWTFIIVTVTTALIAWLPLNRQVKEG